MNEILTAITTVGFPIVCCIFLWRFISETLESFRSTISRTLESFRSTITVQNELLKRICDRLDLDIEERAEDL